MSDKLAAIDWKTLVSTHSLLKWWLESNHLTFSVHFSVTLLMFHIFNAQKCRKLVIFQIFKGGRLHGALSFWGQQKNQSIENFMNYKILCHPKRPNVCIGVQATKTENSEVSKSRLQCVRMHLTSSSDMLEQNSFFHLKEETQSFKMSATRNLYDE